MSQGSNQKPTLNIGIEEEYQTVDPVTRDLCSHIQAEIVQKGKLILHEHVKPEMHQSVVEIGTGICQNIKQARDEVRMIRQKIITLNIPGISPDEITAHFNLLPERYFIQTDASEITLHIQMVNRLLHSISAADSLGSLRPVIEWKDDINRSYTTVHVVTWDRAGLFYKLAGAFSVAGLSILSAHITTRSDHIAIDTFHVVVPGRGVVQNQQAMETFARTVEDGLVSNKDLMPDITAQAKKYAAATRYTATSQALPATFPPTVDVYHELSLNRIIVEVQAHDQIGLLFRLVKTISDHGYDTTFARINTERSIALDTFYIESSKPDATVDTARLQALKEALRGVITPAPTEAASA